MGSILAIGPVFLINYGWFIVEKAIVVHKLRRTEHHYGRKWTRD